MDPKSLLKLEESNRLWHSSPLDFITKDKQSVMEPPAVNSFFQTEITLEIPLYMKEMVEKKASGSQSSSKEKIVFSFYTPSPISSSIANTNLPKASSKRTGISSIPQNESDIYVQQFIEIFNK